MPIDWQTRTKAKNRNRFIRAYHKLRTWDKLFTNNANGRPHSQSRSRSSPRKSGNRRMKDCDQEECNSRYADQDQNRQKRVFAASSSFSGSMIASS